MRLFVAVPVPDGLKKKIAVLGTELTQEGVSQVRPENMHLTLKFIGDVDEQKANGVVKKLEKIKFSKFGCIVRGIGVFPNESYVRVIWAGIESGKQLEKLAAEIHEALAIYGEENEKFTAHLTIARVKKKLEIRNFLIKHKEDVFGKFNVGKIELVQSVLGGTDGPKYITIASFPLV